MKYLILALFLFCLSSCIYNHDNDFPKKNLNVYAHHVRLHRGFVVLNDTLFIGGGYYIKSDSLDLDKDGIYGNLHVGDSLITDNFPEKYIIRVRNNVRTKYFRYSEIKKKTRKR